MPSSPLLLSLLLYAVSAAPKLPTASGAPSRRVSITTSSDNAAGCQAALARKTVVVYASGDPPYLGSLRTFMPNHEVDIEDVALLTLSDPEQAACASSITDITNTLVIWEDGRLPEFQDSLPRNLVSTKGMLVLYGKPGRTGKGIDDLSFFLGGLKSVGGLSVYDLDGLNDLQGLSSLQQVAGDLIISENMGLRDLDGLQQLQIVGKDLNANSNMNLLSVNGLQGLQTIGGHLMLKGNGQLRTLDAMTSLRSIGSTVTLINNGNHNMRVPRGVAIGPEGDAQVAAERASEGPGGYEGAVLVIYGEEQPTLDEVADTSFAFMPPLQNFLVTSQNTRFMPSGEAVPTNPGGVIRGHIIIWDDGTLQPLSSTLHHVTNITGSLLYLGGVAISSDLDQAGLQNFYGMDSLQSVGALGVVGASQMTDLKGLESLEHVEGSLTVAFNARIKSLEGLAPEGAAIVAASPLSRLMRSRLTGERKLAQAPSSRGNGVRSVQSEVTILSNPELRDLTGLEALEEVNWRMTISDNRQLQSLAALGSLRRVGGGLVVLNNPQLTTTAGLLSLEDVGLHAHFIWNTNLRDIDGLSNIKSVKGDVVIVASPITDLSPLTKLTSIGLNLVLSRLGIQDMKGLGSLVSVGGLLDVSENPSLATLNGLSSLATVGDAVYIIANPALTSLGPLVKTLRSATDVYLEGNNAAPHVPSSWVDAVSEDVPLPAPAPPPLVSANTLADSAKAALEHASSSAIANPVGPRDAAYGAVPGSLGGAQ